MTTTYEQTKDPLTKVQLKSGPLKTGPLKTSDEWGVPAIEGDAELKVLLGRLAEQLGTGEPGGQNASGAISDLRARLAGLAGKTDALRAESRLNAGQSAGGQNDVGQEYGVQKDSGLSPTRVTAGGSDQVSGERVARVYQSVAARYSEVSAGAPNRRAKSPAKVNLAVSKPMPMPAETLDPADGWGTLATAMADDARFDQPLEYAGEYAGKYTSDDDIWDDSSIAALTAGYETPVATKSNPVRSKFAAPLPAAAPAPAAAAMAAARSAAVPQTQTAATGLAPADRAWLEGRMAELSKLTQRLADDTGDEAGLGAIAQRLGSLEMRLDQAIDSDQGATNPGAGNDALVHLADRIIALESRIEDAITQGPDTLALTRIEHELANIRDDVERVSRDAQRLASVEDGLARVIEDIGHAHAGMPLLADQAAEKAIAPLPAMLSGMLRDWQGQTNGGPASGPLAGDTETVNRLGEIERSVKTLSQDFSSADQQTAELLDAVRNLLMDLNDRIEGIEQKVTGPRASQPAEVVAPAPAAAAPAAVVAAPPPSAAIEIESEAVAPDATPKLGGMIGRLRGQRQAASEGQEPGSPSFEPMSAAGAGERRGQNLDRDELIAAARRAAGQPAIGGREAPRGRGPQAAAPVAHAGRAPESRLSGRRMFSLGRGSKAGPRPVLIVAVIALTTAGAVMLYGKLTKKAAPPIQIEQTLPAKVDAKPKKKPEVEAPAVEAPAADAPAVDAPKLDKNTSLDGVDLFQGDNSAVSLNGEPGSTTIDNGQPVPDGLVGVTVDDGAAMPAEPAANPAVVGDAGTEDASPTLASLNGSDAANPDDAAPAPTKLELPPKGLVSEQIRQAAAHGDPSAAFAVASKLMLEADDQQTSAGAALWFQRSASAGYAPAQYRLGSMFERGRGVAKDLGRAKAWYQRAAEQGNVKAMHNLGVLSTSQASARPDYQAAAKWFKEAARFGLADSEFNLGILYENGLGVERNTVEAYHWFALAAVSGDNEAAKRRDNVRRRIAPNVADKVDKLVGTFAAHPVDPAVNEPAPEQTASSDAAAVPGILAEALSGQPMATEQSVAKAVGPADILLAQQLLGKLGYSSGRPTGKLTKATEAAIKSFEIRSGLDPTGQVTGSLIARLQELAG